MKFSKRSVTSIVVLLASVLLASCTQSPSPTQDVSLESLANVSTDYNFEGFHRAYDDKDDVEAEAKRRARAKVSFFERERSVKCFDYDFTEVINYKSDANVFGNDEWESKAKLTVSCTNINIFNPLIFNWQWYVAIHPDLRAAGIDTALEARQHWLEFGLSEGREGSAAFMGRAYVARHRDLAQAWPDAYVYIRAAAHYVLEFNAEPGRRAGRVDVLDSRVFDQANYFNRYAAEFRGAGITTPARAKQHWLEAGIYEGRQGNATFNAQTYLQLHSDLRSAFTGTTRLARATQHYLEFGIAENRRIR